MMKSLEDAFRLHEIEHENRDLSKQLRDLLSTANDDAPANTVGRPAG
jgi:hypothetical protein